MEQLEELRLKLVIKVKKKVEAVSIDSEILMCMFETQIPPRGYLSEAFS